LNQKTAVVILNYNGEKYLRQFLPSVIRYTPQATVIVADNASTDASLSILKNEFPSVQVIKLVENYGFCGGYNRALKQVQADNYVLLNSDVEVTEDWLLPLLQTLYKHTDIAAVQPKILSHTQKNSFEHAGAGGGLIDAFAYPFCRGRVFDAVEIDTGQYNDEKEIFWASGACMLVRASTYHQHGGLDEDFFAHMEEIDLCWRMKREGLKIFYNGNSTVYHVGGGTLSKLSPRKTFLNFRNGLYMILKNWSIRELVFKLPIRIALDYIAAFKFLITQEPTHSLSVVRAHYQVARNMRAMLKKRKHNNKILSSSKQLAGLYPYSIVWAYFVSGKKKVEI
jgi:GT2 family glycosyltransferase